MKAEERTGTGTYSSTVTTRCGLGSPSGQGLWPAFWLLEPEGKWPPEIDIIENLGNDPTRAHLCLHWGTGSGGSSCGNYNGLTAGGWHVYGLEWTANSIRWYIDGVLRREVTNQSQIPDAPMYMLINLQIGGSWPGSPNSSTPFPADFEIDYVRAWSR